MARSSTEAGYVYKVGRKLDINKILRFAVYCEKSHSPLQIGVNFISRKSGRYNLHAVELRRPEIC